MAQALILRRGYYQTQFPLFTYTGTYQFLTEGNGHWKLPPPGDTMS